MRLKSLYDLKKEDLAGKRVFLRVDFNVPLSKGGAIGKEEDWRIVRAQPTIEYLKECGARITVASHLGRPKGKKVSNLKLNAVARRLAHVLRSRVQKVDEVIGKKVEAAAARLKPGAVLMLENLRFHSGEEKNDLKFARELANLADIFVNDAFGAAHHASASTVGITKFLPSYAGFLMSTEVAALSHILKKPAQPFVVMIGGAKVSSKIGVINNLLKRAKAVLLGGALVNAFFKAAGYEVGAAKVEIEDISYARKLLKNKKVHLPVDVIIGNIKKPQAHGQVVSLEFLNSRRICGGAESILDVGPATVLAYAKRLKKAKSIVWNGPLGMFETRQFSHGTLSLARIVAAKSHGKAFGIVGGGETVQALMRTGMAEYVDHVSTGGGAMLEFLEGKILPGIKPLIKQ